jgi:chromatin segregation and condensation protein Rec8/ScpA/Scc1 (kleisin family)
MDAADAVPMGISDENSGNEFEREMLSLMPGENSWEQILYQVVAMKNLDPWSMDLGALSKGFSEYISSLEDVDFRIPAKWVIIFAVLLRMKSDHIRILKMDRGPEDSLYTMDELDSLGGGAEDFIGPMGELRKEDIMPMEASPKRMPIRRVTITELVDSLRKVLASGERREEGIRERIGRVNISTEDIAARIEGLYKRITGMLGKVDGGEITFSELVGKWERGNVIDHFMPLVHLDNDKKVECRQKEMFNEIFIKGRKQASLLSAANKSAGLRCDGNAEAERGRKGA